MEKILCFLKFTTKEFADKLLKEGEIYFNLSSYFNESAEDERGDDNEGAELIVNGELLNMKVSVPSLGLFECKPTSVSSSKIIQYNYCYLSFSLYALTEELFDNNDTYQNDARMTEFGDIAILITKPLTFLRTIIAELKSKNLNYEMRSVNYRTIPDGIVEIDPFDKKMEHQHQREFRIIIENTDNTAKTIKIGSIEKYCRLVSSELIVKNNCQLVTTGLS